MIRLFNKNVVYSQSPINYSFLLDEYQMTCDIKYASIGSGNGWAECDKPTKELESAVANMIANGIKLDSDTDTGGIVDDVSSGKGLKTCTNVLKTTGDNYCDSFNNVENFDVRSKLKKVDKNNLRTSHLNVHGKSAAGTDGRNSKDTSDVKVDKYMNESGGDIEDECAELSEHEAKKFDNELIMKCLADKVQTESKFVISVFDFGGQSIFNVIHHFFFNKIWGLCSRL